MGARGLRMEAAFWAGIPVVVTQEAGIVPRCHRDILLVASYDTQGNGGYILPTPTGGMIRAARFCSFTRGSRVELNGGIK